MEMKVNRELIKELRLKKSWSQERLAEEARVSMRTIQRIETDGIASLQSRAAIANVFEIEPAELDVELIEVVESGKLENIQTRFLSVALNWIKSTLRTINMALASVASVCLFTMALLKPFIPSNVGLFSTETTLTFGIVEDTVYMQEHLGYWIIPLAFLAGWLLVMFVNRLVRAKTEIGLT